MIANSPAAKYLLVIKNQFSQVLSYRFEIFGNFFFRIFGFLVFFFIWSLTANNQSELSKLFIYYFLFYCIFNSFMTSRPAKWIGQTIATGEFSNYLLKPISFPLVNSIKYVALVSARLIMPVAVFLVAVVLRPDLFADTSSLAIAMFAVYAALGVLLWNLFMNFMGSMAFWVTEIGFTLTVIDLVLNFFNGAWIPFYLYPQWLLDWLTWTPIPYLGGFQIMIWQGDLSLTEIIKGSTSLLIWLIFFYTISKLIYHRGIKKYEAFGN